MSNGTSDLDNGLRHTFRGRVIKAGHHRVGFFHRHDSAFMTIHLDPQPVAHYNEGVSRMMPPGQLALAQQTIPYELNVDLTREGERAFPVGTEIGAIFTYYLLLGMILTDVKVATPGQRFNNEYTATLPAAVAVPA